MNHILFTRLLYVTNTALSIILSCFVARHVDFRRKTARRVTTEFPFSESLEARISPEKLGLSERIWYFLVKNPERFAFAGQFIDSLRGSHRCRRSTATGPNEMCTFALHDITIFCGSVSHAVDKSCLYNTIKTCAASILLATRGKVCAERIIMHIYSTKYSSGLIIRLIII